MTCKNVVGNKAKKAKNVVEVERKLELKDDEDFQEYAGITKVYGNNRYEANCMDGKVRLAHAGGRLKRKKIFIKLGDVVVVSLRTFQDDKCDILHVYKPKEITELRKLGQISSEICADMSGGAVELAEDTGGVDFDYDVSEESKELDFDAI